MNFSASKKNGAPVGLLRKLSQLRIEKLSRPQHSDQELIPRTFDYMIEEKACLEYFVEKYVALRKQSNNSVKK